MTDDGSARQAFHRAEALLRERRTQPAVRELREILRTHPDEVNTLRLLGAVRLAQGDITAAIEHLTRAVRHAPGFLQAALDLARAYRQAGRLDEAIECLQDCCAQAPDNAEAWELLGDALVERGETLAGRDAFRRAAAADPYRQAIATALEALRRGDRRAAERTFRGILKQRPDHVAALVGLANIALDANAADDAERLLLHAVKLTPNMDTVWRGLARVHSERADYNGAEAAARRALALAPDNADCWTMLGTVQAWGLRPERARASFERALELKPHQPRVALSLGHVLKTIGDRAACEQAYRRAADLDPGLGEAWWSLADLKNYAFRDAEIRQLESGIAMRHPDPAQQAAFHFALGKALEDRGDHDEAFAQYAAGNAVKHAQDPFDSAALTERRQQIEAVFTREFLASREHRSPAAATPIFIIGLPRSGSTLIEQILASHSAVQGTMELPQIQNYTREMDARGGYPEVLTDMGPAELDALGERYLRETDPYRGGATCFLDKMPNNFFHVGLIHLMLPGALFIDARRHPLDCCCSLFKQNFARGQTFSYSLEVLGAYYRDYLALMRHWDIALPGRVLRVHYESVVDDTEAQVRRLLDHCGLPFEDACLRFYETKRPVRTASAEQVRQPINRKGIDSWRRFSTHLEPLEKALGDAVERHAD
ncbi:MAG: sulfotransferase [Gammaproteobacteria bacterium]|nr:sulfotransferase [Gammaproteobacteria bacterium]MDE0412734.1 sulfotransferase [Gammaproteobacteria bacterium]